MSEICFRLVRGTRIGGINFSRATPFEVAQITQSLPLSALNHVVPKNSGRLAIMAPEHLPDEIATLIRRSDKIQMQLFGALYQPTTNDLMSLPKQIGIATNLFIEEAGREVEKSAVIIDAGTEEPLVDDLSEIFSFPSIIISREIIGRGVESLKAFNLAINIAKQIGALKILQEASDLNMQVTNDGIRLFSNIYAYNFGLMFLLINPTDRVLIHFLSAAFFEPAQRLLSIMPQDDRKNFLFTILVDKRPNSPTQTEKNPLMFGRPTFVSINPTGQPIFMHYPTTEEVAN